MKNQEVLLLFSVIFAALLSSYLCLDYSETHYSSDPYGNIKYSYTLQTGNSKVQFRQEEPNKRLPPIAPPPLIYRPVFGFGGFRPLQYRPIFLQIIQPRALVLEPSATANGAVTKRITRAKPAEADKEKLSRIVKIDKGHVPRYPIIHKLDQRTLYSHGHLYSDDPLAGYYVG